MKPLQEILFNKFFKDLHKKNYKRQYFTLLNDYETLKSMVDIEYLKPIEGPLREYQLKTFDFVENFLDVFDKNNLEYFIICGTLLGAVRHKGFIPWDDDFDIGMMRNNYQNLYNFCKKNYIEIDTSKISFTKNNRHEIWFEYMRNYPNHILFSKTPNHIQIIKGTNLDDVLCLDIFPFDYYAENYTMTKHKKYVTEIREKRQKIDNWKEVCKFNDVEIQNNKNIVEKSDKIFYGIDSLMSYLFFETFNNWYKFEDFYPLKNIEFENKSLITINQPPIMCENLYGNYMKLPENLTFGEHINRKNLSKEKYKKSNISNKIFSFFKASNIKHRKSNSLDFEQYFKKINAQKQIDILAKKMKNKKILLYGAGMYAKKLFSMCDLSKLNIVGIADKSYSRNKIKNTPFEPIMPSEIRTIDFEEIFTVLYDDSVAIDFIEKCVYINPENLDKDIRPLLKPTLNTIFKSLLN